MQLGKAIKETRRKKGISQGDLAKELKVSQTYLSLVESNTKSPSFDLIQRISDVLGIPAYYFMFKGLEIDKDISEDKRESYKQISPILESMIEKFFIPDEAKS